MEGHLLDVFSGELFHDMKQVEYIHIYIQLASRSFAHDLFKCFGIS